ncbi:acyl-CoA dehydrogenase family protein [Actinomadura viridis]|uniref:Alkylation response protein AidB-like acyl-CoA dehydrogenase n=1 Tax=Actinomadura viridis TaxID=58110 RepID=A0A931DPV9_9ACTN|nr:acyl-CoA dehydrogenase family protein [Actinomadura viridis]MBG6091155.1 alkylation response protein AidB-like acyl-CoA dehydrogenase [Actinomadura viridis]
MTDLDEYGRRARAWLDAHARDLPREADLQTARAFMAELYDAGYSGITWPAEYGGQGLSAAEERVFQEAARDATMPVGPFGIGLGMCGPTLLSIGTEEQKRRYVRPLLRGEEIWCQLFSEPGAGSDVASLQTRAVRDGDAWVVNGQKVWTSVGRQADFGLLIARTDPDVPKHRGITMFIVDMHDPGVTVRPLRDMTGQSHFNEIFFDDVRIAPDQVVGEVNGGWAAAVTTLLHERVSIGMGATRTERPTSFAAMSEAARSRGLLEDAAVRDQLVDLYVRERALDLFNARLSQEVRAGIQPGARGSVAKLLLAELLMNGADVASEILGPDAVAYEDGEGVVARALSFAPGMALGGGTNEIMRNIIGDRVLGLPREPQVDRTVPFRDLKVGTQVKEAGA